MIKLDVNRVINSAKNSYRSPANRPQSRTEGPVIEEITGDERALIDALKSVGASPPTSASAKPASNESKAPSPESPAPSAESKPPSADVPKSATLSKNSSSGETKTGSPSAPPSENGSATGASQTANSFVLVDDDYPAHGNTSEPIAKPSEPENPSPDDVHRPNQPQEEAHQESEKEYLDDQSEQNTTAPVEA
jgi:hypothetical protein